MKSARSAVLGIAAALLGLALLLRRYPPGLYAFYPRCPVRQYLHLDCPGCGATRALAALLQGHLAEALHWNALLILLLPLLLAFGLLCGYRAWTADIYRWPVAPPWALRLCLALVAVFTVLRNLPVGTIPLH